MTHILYIWIPGNEQANMAIREDENHNFIKFKYTFKTLLLLLLLY